MSHLHLCSLPGASSECCCHLEGQPLYLTAKTATGTCTRPLSSLLVHQTWSQGCQARAKATSTSCPLLSTAPSPNANPKKWKSKGQSLVYSKKSHQNSAPTKKKKEEVERKNKSHQKTPTKSSSFCFSTTTEREVSGASVPSSVEKRHKCFDTFDIYR